MRSRDQLLLASKAAIKPGRIEYALFRTMSDSRS